MAADGRTPILLYRRHRSRDRSPLLEPSAARTRWRIGCVSSARLPYPGVGRARWSVELVRQRGGTPFSLQLDGCDDTGRLSLPRSEEHTSELQSLMRISYAVFCLK